MTVKELIEKLKKFDENKYVHIPADFGYAIVLRVEEENNMIYLEWEE